MTPDERNLISGLFDRLRKADSAAGNKDAEALQLIQQQTTAVPSAPYLLVQTLLVQEHALTNAQARIADLERQVAAGARPAGQEPEEHGSFLGNLVKRVTGAPTATPPPLPAQARAPGQPMMMPPAPGGAMPYQPQGQPAGYGGQQPPPMPYPTTSTMPASGGGSFLKSALGTAAGVAGGAMLFQGIQGLMGHNAGPFAGGMSGLGGGHAGAGDQGFLGGGGAAGVTNNYYGDNAGHPGGGGSVGDFADRSGGAGGQGGSDDFAERFAGGDSGGSGGGTVGDYADTQGGGGGGGFFDNAPEVQDASFDDQGGSGGGSVGDFMDNSGGGGGADDGGGFFDSGGGSDDSGTV